MPFEVFLAILIPAALVSAAFSVRQRRRVLTWQLVSEWGARKSAVVTDEDARGALRRCFLVMPQTETPAAWVDGITWSDLDMDAVFRHLNRTQSGVGEEALYRMLHAIDVSDVDLRKRDRWIRALGGDKTNRMALQRRLRTLGREHDHGAFSFLKNPEVSRPAHAWAYYSLAAAPLVFAGMGFVSPFWLLGILFSFLVNAIVYYRTKQARMRELAAIRHLAGVLRCGRRLRRHPVAGMEDAFEELNELCVKLKPITRWNSLFYMQRVNEFDFITDYLRIAFQLDMVAFIKLTGFIVGHGAEIARLYLLVGEIDACIAVASLRASLKVYAVPEFRAEKRVQIEGAAHPLLYDPVVNDMDWMENMLVTGSNASGKSTFVKAIALNAILAQSVCTCYAARVRMPRTQVLSSMAIRDNVQGGESYFIVEIKSLKRILSALRDDRITLCFIDEILRGTNTVERIAASASLLSYLNGQNALCVAATHDIELTKLLPEYRQVHFREEITPQGMVFPYKLFEGVSDTRNAIRLLEQMGFPQQIIESADKMADVTDSMN